MIQIVFLFTLLNFVTSTPQKKERKKTHSIIHDLSEGVKNIKIINTLLKKTNLRKNHRVSSSSLGHDDLKVGTSKNPDRLTYEILYKKPVEKPNTHDSKQHLSVTHVNTMPSNCFNFASNSSGFNINNHWVVMLPYEHNFSSECVAVNQVTRVGAFYIYDLSAMELSTVVGLVSTEENLIIFENKRIEVGPGRLDLIENQQPIPHIRDYKRLKQYPPFKGVMRGDAIDCRTEPTSNNRGFTEGFFSWGIDRTDQRSAVLDGTYCSPNIGTNVNVYILDTGVAQHSSFANSVHYDFSYYETNPASIPDGNGHGTHVGGLIGSSIYGMARGVTIHSIKVLGSDGGGTYASLLAGLMFVYQHIQSGTLNVINMSLGARDTGSSSITNVINNIIIDKKAPVIVSAGNLAEDACSSYPASIPAAFTVAAMDVNNNKAYFSNYGSCVDIWAAGDTIISAFSTSGSAIKSGTSMSAPIVTGGVALFLSHYNNPNLPVSSVLNAVIIGATPNVIGNMQPSPSSTSYLIYVGPNSITDPNTNSPSPTPTPLSPSSPPRPSPPTTPTGNSNNSYYRGNSIFTSIVLFIILQFWNMVV